MASVRPALAAHGATSLFVLLWSSGAIFAELGLRHASAFAFLIARFALASLVLLVLSLARRRWLPPRGARRATLATGLLLTGGYSILYLLALERGLAPGILATILGVQPILTLAVLERRASPARLAGLALALTGLSLVVYRSVAGGAAPAAAPRARSARCSRSRRARCCKNAYAPRRSTCSRCRTRSALHCAR